MILFYTINKLQRCLVHVNYNLNFSQDLAALGFVDGVDVGEPAEAAAAVADDEADGAAPSAARLAGRVLGGDVEVLVEVALDAPASLLISKDCRNFLFVEWKGTK